MTNRPAWSIHLNSAPRLQFSLRAFLIAFTLIAIWLGYHIHWISERRKARIWIDQHVVPGQLCAFGSLPSMRDFPWTLQLLGEEPCEWEVVAPNEMERGDLNSFRKRVAHVDALFPECRIVDQSVVLEAMGNPEMVER